MNASIVRAVLVCPELLRTLDIHGIERAALGFEIMLAATPRDDHGHFYKDEGAPCPHKKGGKSIKQKSEIKLSESEQWDNWGKGRNAVDETLKGKSIPKAMKRVNGEDVNFIYDKLGRFGFVHTESKLEIRDKDRICETIAFGVDEELTPRDKLLLRYNGFLVVLNSKEKDGSRNFTSGYLENETYKNNRRKKK